MLSNNPDFIVLTALIGFADQCDVSIELLTEALGGADIAKKIFGTYDAECNGTQEEEEATVKVLLDTIKTYKDKVVATLP